MTIGINCLNRVRRNRRLLPSRRHPKCRCYTFICRYLALQVFDVIVFELSNAVISNVTKNG